MVPHLVGVSWPVCRVGCGRTWPVPITSPYQVTVDDADRAVLAALTRRSTAAYRQVLRARIVLAAAEGNTNAAIAAELGLHVDTVRKWRRRFTEAGLAGLADRDRPGRPARFTPVQVAQVKALACEPPTATGTPLARWSCPELARQAVAASIVDTVSASTVRRWLATDALKPWQHRSWIFPRDPEFAAKAARALDLYAGLFDGEPLGEGDFVISADEKTSIQARRRDHPSLPTAPGAPMRIEHTYQRGGALAYLAGWDVGRGQVTGRCEPATGRAPFARLVAQVMAAEPYASARRVFWIVDNGSSHRGEVSTRRITRAWPNAHLIHLPVHASWLNQIEIYFSIVQRKVLTPNDFVDLPDVETRLSAFEHRYNAAAKPFDWKFTKTDLDALLKRLATHQDRPLPAAA
jgi:transposase